MVYLACIFIPVLATAFMMSRCNIKSLAPASHQKHHTLDPLRGIAATAVMSHHSLLMYNLMNGGSWLTLGPTIQMTAVYKRLFDSLGNVPVSIFFMITSFLFFERLIQKGGILNTAEFYIKRGSRIIPMYLAMVICVMLTYVAFGVNGGIYEITKALVSWLSFSFLPIKSVSDQLIGGRAAAGVIWTLAIEWKFYILIPIIGVFTKSLKAAIVFAFISMFMLLSFYALGLQSERETVIALCFVTGMVSACICQLKNEAINAILKHWLFSFLCIIPMAVAIFFTTGEYTFYLWIGISIFFIFVSNGNTLIGVLNSESLRLLGLISYSVYLMHGVLFALMFGVILKGINFNLSIVLTTPIIVLICTLTYIYIERRFSSPVTRRKTEINA